MKVFLDSANTAEIEKYLTWGICQGATTNPTICLKDGVRGGTEGVKKRIIEIAELIDPYPVSVEVTTDIVEEVIAQAKECSGWAENIAVKVTISDREGNPLLPAIYELVKEGVAVNVTAMTTFNQAILSARAIRTALEKRKAGNDKTNFISIFAGRISEEHGVQQARKVVESVRKWLDFYEYQGIEIIVGSVRSRENVEYWAQSGAHVLTIPPRVLSDCLIAARTKETVDQFLADAKKALKIL